MNNSDSLRKQIIDSMKLYCDKYKFYTLNEAMMFDDAIMPVLDAAMKAGELLLSRATKPQIPVHDALVQWLELSLPIISSLLAKEKTVSKAEALRCLQQLHDNAQVALKESRAIDPAKMELERLRSLKPGSNGVLKPGWKDSFLSSIKTKGRA